MIFKLGIQLLGYNMGHKEKIYRALGYETVTISDIQQRGINLPRPDIRNYLKRLVEEGKVKRKGKRGKETLYRVDNFNSYTTGFALTKFKDYPDFWVDHQALQFTLTQMDLLKTKFLEKPKVNQFHLGIKNYFIGSGEEEERDIVPYHSCQLLIHLLWPTHENY